jgi:hypothetical protein
MHRTRWTLCLLALAVMVVPATLSAQSASDFCAATSPANAPTCSKTKDVTTTINSLLYLGIISNGPIGLQANDTSAYEKTYRANGNSAGTTGTPVATPATLQAAAASDSVVVRANRGYKLTIEGTTDLFQFDKDASYNVCRSTTVSTTGCSAAEALAGKPVTDLYWSDGIASYAPVKGATAAAISPTVVTTSATGGRYGAPILFKSAWYYGTDIPGVYTATVRYTVTGQ